MKEISIQKQPTILTKNQLKNIKGGEMTDESGAELKKQVTIKRG